MYQSITRKLMGTALLLLTVAGVTNDAIAAFSSRVDLLEAKEIYVCSDWPELSADVLARFFALQFPDKPKPEFAPFPKSIEPDADGALFLTLSGKEPGTNVLECLTKLPQGWKDTFIEGREALGEPLAPSIRKFMKHADKLGPLAATTRYNRTSTAPFIAHFRMTLDPHDERDVIRTLFGLEDSFCSTSKACSVLTPLPASPALQSYKGTAVERWHTLWSKCQTAIEETGTLNHDGLIRYVPQKDNSSKLSSEVWTVQNSEFYLEIAHLNSAPDTPRSSCRVALKPEAAPLSTADQALMLQAFLDIRSRLIWEGTHEIKNPDSTYPMLSLGFSPKEKSRRRCPIIHVMHSDPSAGYIATTSGEQAGKGCQAQN